MSDLPAYRPPTGEPIALSTLPRLASWDRKTHPSQIALRRYLDATEELLQEALKSDAEFLALQLDIGLGPVPDLLIHRDLDNYLQPLADRLPSRVCSYWATKSTAEASTIRIAEATPAEPSDLNGWDFVKASCSDSAPNSAEWKRSITAQLANHAKLAPDGAVELQVTFRVGAGRNWRTLWKPAIDALDPILGRTEPGREFHPRDDRVTRIGLHRLEDPSLGHAVELGVWWRLAPNQPRDEISRPVFPRAAPVSTPADREPAPNRRSVSVPRARSEAAPDDRVVIFRGDDEPYLRWLDEHFEGYVVNTPRSPSPRYLKLHRSWCPTISGPHKSPGAWTARQYIKVCSSSREALEAWANGLGGTLEPTCHCNSPPSP